MSLTNLVAIGFICVVLSVLFWRFLGDKPIRTQSDPPPFYSDLLAKERYRAQAAWGETFKARAITARLGIRIHNQRKRIAELMRQQAVASEPDKSRTDKA